MSSNRIKFLVTVCVFAVVFFAPLFDWARLGWQSSLYSHTLLIPFISAFLIWSRRDECPPDSGRPSMTGIVALIGMMATAIIIWKSWVSGLVSPEDRAFGSGLTWILAFIVGIGILYGKRFIRTYFFPLMFLGFALPFPEGLRNGMEIWSQRASADAFHAFIAASGVPFLRDGLVFQMPGLNIEVAQECSGIRSSWVLLVTSVLAGYWILERPSSRIILALAVIPLGILRNGFRVLTISLLTMRVDPEIINGPLHHHGGPVFFALSLIPFLGLLIWLRRRERKLGSAGRGNSQEHGAPGKQEAADGGADVSSPEAIESRQGSEQAAGKS